VDNKLTLDSQYRHYFSGSQCRVYFDGEFVDDVNYLEFSIVSNKAPIYSYNDPYYKMVAMGNYLVQGSFTINFTEKGYLLNIKDRLAEQNRKGIESTSIFPTVSDNTAMRFLNSADSKSKETAIRYYENLYWYKKSNRESGTLSRKNPYNWDLSDTGIIDARGFDIIMLAGYPFGTSNQYNLKQINDVHITGQTMTVLDNGQPLVEQYPFFARSLDLEPTIYYEDDKHTIEAPDVKVPDPEGTKAPDTIDIKREIEKSFVYVTIHKEMVGSTGWRAKVILDPAEISKYYIKDVVLPHSNAVGNPYRKPGNATRGLGGTESQLKYGGYTISYGYDLYSGIPISKYPLIISGIRVVLVSRKYPNISGITNTLIPRDRYIVGGDSVRPGTITINRPAVKGEVPPRVISNAPSVHGMSEVTTGMTRLK